MITTKLQRRVFKYIQHKQCSFIQGVEAEGGGERKGMVVGIEGKLGSEVAGSGGRVSFGMVGMVGRDGCGRDGIVGKGGTLP